MSKKGYKQTEEHKIKISNAMKKNPPMYWLGKKRPNLFSEESRRKMRLAKIGKKRKPFTIQQRINMGLARKGDKCWNWKGGISPESRIIRNSIEYKLWREAVFERDNYTCIWCGVRSGNGKRVTLNADHIKPFSQYPELRFAIDNGRTLCVDCHKTTDTFGGKSLKFINNIK